MENAKLIIDSLGGPTEVARILGILDKPGSVQRVDNWKRRGIPAQVQLEYGHLLRRALRKASKEPANV